MDCRRIGTAFIAFFVFFCGSVKAHDSRTDDDPHSYTDAAELTTPSPYTRRLFERLVGVPAPYRSALLSRMQKQIDQNEYLEAAKTALRDKRFFSLTLRNFSAPWSNIEFDPGEGFNDLQALFIGIARDDLDARELLTADYRYQGYDDLFLPQVSLSNNNHYRDFEGRGLDPWKDLRRRNVQWDEFDEAAGALTTRTWAKAHFDAGTNRRAIEYAFKVFMCAPMERWRDIGLMDSYVRRDVSRTPGGNPATYQNHCRNCHAGMDSLGGAVSRYDFKDNVFSQAPLGTVVDKMNQNGASYPAGYQTFDNHWVNLSTKNHNKALGWRGELRGRGLHEFGKMLANSRGFSKCMVEKVFNEVCGRSLERKEAKMTDELANDFEKSGYKIKQLFANISVQKTCIAHSRTEVK